MSALKKTRLAAGAVSLALVFSACGGVAGGGDGDTVQLKATNLLPPSDIQSQMIQWFMDELEKRTDGEVETEVIHAGALLPGADTLPGLQQGRADAGNVVHAYFPAELPLHNVNVVPIEGDQSARMRAFKAVSDEVDAWTEELEANDLKLIGFLPQTSSAASWNEPISSLGDVDGLKMRVPADTVATAWQSFGVEPIFMPVEEVYEAVERGIVNGTLYPVSTQVSTGIIDVVETVTPDVGQHGGGTFAFSEASYDKLSDDAKDVVAELQGEWYDKADELLGTLEAEACDEFLASGVEVHLWTEEEQAELSASIPEALEVWRSSTAEAGVDSADIDAVWDTFSGSVEENSGTGDYVDGLVACAEQQ